MIPVRLELRDFLSYAEPVTLDFTGFGVACLTGDNGSGKSALLDAMTFAIWGRARGCEGGVHQERLIRDGAEEAFVDFTFELNEQRYQVIRRRSRSGKSDLRFQIADGDDWRNLGGETLRETDEKIKHVLRMDYRTFAASAFFVQGRADDFLRMAPDGRKEVFSQLLDLDTYERLADVAREGAREADRRRSVHASDIEKYSGAREDVERIQDDISHARASAERAECTADQAKAASEAARHALAEHEKAEALVRAERERLANLATTIDQLERSLEAKTGQLAETDELLARTEEVDERIAEVAELRKQDDAARVCEQKASALEARRAGALASIEGERRTLRKQLEASRSFTKRLEIEHGQLAEFTAKLAAVDAALAENADPRGSIEEARDQVDAQKSAIVRFEEQHRALEVRINETQDKIALLTAGGGECPVCGTALDVAHRRKVKSSLAAEGRGLVRERDSVRAARDTARKEAARCAEDLKRLQRTLSDHEGLVTLQKELRARLERAPVVRDELAAARIEIDRVTALLADEVFAKQLFAQISALDAEIAGTYDAAAHERVLARLKELQPYDALKGRLVEAGRMRQTLQADIQDMREYLEGARADHDERAARIVDLENGLAAGRELQRAFAGAEAALKEARQAVTDAAKALAALEERLDTARCNHAELERAEAAEKDAALEHRRYRRLVEAFGRSGIPQRIIENERPQLEHEANRILDRLTDDPMAVQFQFHRETKAGKPKETLEVLVRPHDGEPRDFSMFSGGEAFRIAFAVRLAMSKLLVRRAGARLETLVIDEGFGTQDPQGRERLIEAINLAREEFAKVLVITHLEDLKDQFGVQVVVTKTATGSIVRLERG